MNSSSKPNSKASVKADKASPSNDSQASGKKASSSSAKSAKPGGKTKSTAKSTSRASHGKAAQAQSLDPKVSTQPTPLETLAPPALISPAPFHPTPEYEYLGELPESYGSRALYLVARDPQYLFAYWDFSEEQLHELARNSSDGKVFLQLHLEGGEKVQQIEIHAHSKHWYIHANRPNTQFYCELGFYRDGHFQTVARSGTIRAPRDTISDNTRARFVTLPFHISFQHLLNIIRSVMLPGEELAEALARLQEDGYVLPFDVERITPSLDRANQIYNHLGDKIHHTLRVGSIDITEVLRRRFEEITSSGQWPTSSPFGSSFGASARRGFFMNVNAELIIYGGTDPKATVRIAGRELPLREDGTFSFHFNLPDGQFHIPIEATSPDRVETRSAMLSFLRITDTAGEVEATPQTPRPEPLGRVA